MHSWLRVVAAVLVLVVGGGSAVHGQSTRYPGGIAFVNVTVLPMTGERTVAGQTVLVRNGRIDTVGSAADVTVPASALVVDGAGKFLMPGVAEMHGHYPGSPDSQFFQDVLFLYVANGVLMVRGMQGAEMHIPLRDAIERREVLGPRLWVSAPALIGVGQSALTDPVEAEQRVRDAKTAGFDHLKVHEELSVEVYDAIARTANELDLPFSGHVSNHVGLLNALEKGQQTIDHLDNFLEAMISDREAVANLGLFDQARLASEIDASRIADVVEATRAAGAGVVPTEALWETFLGSRSGDDMMAIRPEVRYMPVPMVEQWRQQVDQRLAPRADAPDAGQPIIDLRRRMMKALYDAGVPVLLGTDSPQIFSVPGFSIHHEMKIMVESGFTPYEVLYTGTRAVAEFYDAENEFGSIAPGQRADLVLLNRNPIDDIEHFADRAGVMVNGQWLSEAQIQEELDAIARRVTETAAR